MAENNKNIITMKRTLLLTAGLALVLLTGCITLSVYPYYTTKDLTFDPALVGIWSEPDKTDADSETWTFEKLNEQAYRLTVKDKDEKTEFDARLFKLKGFTFLDCLPCKHNDYSAPCHVLLRLNQIQPQLEMHLLDFEWLSNLIEKQPKAIRHTMVVEANAKGDNAKSFVLTADTSELQKFVLKHLKTEEAWGKPMVMKKQ